MEDFTGRQFGAYRVVAALGRGGMAVVYKAHQPVIDRHVALKVLPPHFKADPQFLNRFRHEGKILAQLQHPHILPVYDFGENDGCAFLVMPLVNGGTLDAALKRGPLAGGLLAAVVDQLCDAVDYAHSKGIVHRDIKPSNILLDERGNCFVADFGLARIIADGSNHTQLGAVMGTPAYMSPEQVSGSAVGSASDIYSIGILLYELLTGRVPFVGATPAAVMMAHLASPLPSPRSLNPALTPELEAVLLKALARNPDQRFGSARELQSAVLPLIPGPRRIERSLPRAEQLLPSGSSVFPVIGSDAFRPAVAPNSRAKPSNRARLTAAAALTLGVLAAATAGAVLLRQHFANVDREAAGSRSITSAPDATPHNARESSSPDIPIAHPDVDDHTTSHVVSRDAPASRSPAGRMPAAPSYEPAVVGDLVVAATSAPSLEPVIAPDKADFERTATTSPEQTQSPHPTLLDSTGSLQIRTTPGAEVLVDNMSRGIADGGFLIVENLAPGQHSVQLLSPQKKEYRGTVSVAPTASATVDHPLENMESPAGQTTAAAWDAAVPSPGTKLLLFHFVEGAWHLGVLTLSRGRIAWNETSVAGYATAQSVGFPPQDIEPGLHLDNFSVGCGDVIDVGNNRALIGEHIRLTSRNYNLAAAIKNKDGKLVPKGNAPIPGLHKAAEEACPGVVR